MRTNPFLDAGLFLIGATGEHEAIGAARYVYAALFAALLAASVILARANWRADPAQRGATQLWIWFFRVLIGSMWFQGSLWKLPLPVSGGLQYWTEQMEKYAAFPFVSALVRDVLLPDIAFYGPVVFLAELGLAVSYILGAAVRPVAVLGALYTLGLWIGLYRHPQEWPWEYIFLATVQGMFSVTDAGRCLGLDARLWRRDRAAVPGLG